MAFKKTAIALSATVFVLGAAIFAPNFIDWSHYKQPALDAANKATGYTITLDGALNVRTLPMPHASVSGVVVKNGTETLLTLKQADIRVALLPLLSGKVEVASVDLIEPVITVGKRADGTPTWNNDVIAKPKSDTPSGDAASAESSPSEFSLQKLKIENGTLVYKDAQKGSSFAAQDINTTLKVDSLKGPFAAQGSLKTSDRMVAFDVSAEGIPDGSQKVPVKLTLRIPNQEASLEYAGDVTSFAPIKLEGDFVTNVKSLPALLGRKGDGAFSLKTKLEATDTSIQLNNFVGELAGVDLKGSGALTNLKEGARPNVNLTLAAGDALPLDLILGSVSNDAAKSTEGKGDVNAQAKAQAFLPKKIADSFPFDGTVKISAPAATYRKQNTGPIELTLNAAAGKMAVKLQVQKMPGNAALDLNADVFANPAKILGAVDFKSGAPVTTLHQWLGIAGVDNPTIARMNNLALKTDFALLEKTIAFDDGTLSWDGAALKVAGDYTASSGVNGSVSVSTANAEQVLKSLNMTLPNLPRKLDQATVNLKVKGTKQALDTDLGLSAYGADVTLSGLVNDPFGKYALNDINVRLRHGSLVELLHLVQPNYKGTSAMARPVDLVARVTTQGKNYKLDGLKGQAGPIAISGDIAADMTQKPSITGALKLGALPLSDLMGVQKAASSSGGDTGAAQASSGERWSRQPIDTKWMNAADITLDIKADSLTYNLWKLSNPEIDFSLKGGTVNVSSLSAGLFGGSIKGQGKLTSAPVSLNMSANMNGVNARDLTNALSGKAMNKVSGVLSFNIDMNSSGASPSALIGALNGKGASSGQNITITGIDLGKISQTATGSYKPLERALVLQTALSSGQTTFDTHEGAFSIQNGVVTIGRNIFDGSNAQLITTGALNLPRWTMDTNHKVTVKQPSDVPPFEFTLKGSIDKPVQNILGGAINNYLSSKLQERAVELIDKKLGGKLNELGLGGLLGGGGQQASDTQAPEGAAPQPVEPQQQQPQQLKPEDAVRGLLNGLIR